MSGLLDRIAGFFDSCVRKSKKWICEKYGQIKPVVCRWFSTGWQWLKRNGLTVFNAVFDALKIFGKSLVHGFNIFMGKKVMRSAAEFSFNIVLTLFPLLICMNWLVGRLHTSFDSALEVLAQFLPKSAIEIISGYIDYISGYQSNTALFLGLIMMIMPASAALRSLQGILNDIYNRRRKESLRSFLFSFLASILFLLVVYICMILMVSGNWLLNFLIEQFDLSRLILDWNWMRFLVLFLLLDLMLYILYRFLPFSVNKPRGIFKGVVYPGMLFSSSMLVIVSIIFSYFIGLSTRYSFVYGSLTSIIILMLWLYACSNVIIIGGIVNRLCDEFIRKRISKKRKEEKELAQR